MTIYSKISLLLWGYEMTNSDITNLQPEDFHTSVASTSRAFWPDPMFGFFSRNAVHEHLMLPNYTTAVMRDAVQH